MATAAFRAVTHLIPDVFPFFSPLKRSAADRTGFCGAITRAFHRSERAITFRGGVTTTKFSGGIDIELNNQQQNNVQRF
tara:strand:+ start:131 stop:367 length:237 start_codon:yes stop_codon:yes gene_type:complete